MFLNSHGATYQSKAHGYISPEGEISIWIFAQMSRLAAMALTRCWNRKSTLEASMASCEVVGGWMMVG